MPTPVPEIFLTFLKLGLTSFGGPVAHLSYFHRELVERRRWMDDARYAQVVAICQALPGPASSQVGFAIGMLRGGWLGACAALIAFTLPSALLMVAFASALPWFDHPAARATLFGLKVVAVLVVAQAVWLMAKRLAPDATRRAIAIAVCALVIAFDGQWVQPGVIAIGAVLGVIFCRALERPDVAPFSLAYGSRVALGFILLFAGLLVIALTSAPESIAAAFYRTGALVFGGGHVVLPLLQQAVVDPGLIRQEEFLAAYGAAQALPGPLFSIAAFLGARMDGVAGALLALGAIFLPGFLLVAGALPLWGAIASRPRAFAALAGVNAAVVGLLAAALYDPLLKSVVASVLAAMR